MRKLGWKILIGIVILCVAVFLISWFVFPDWKTTQGGILLLIVASVIGVLSFVLLIVEIMEKIFALTKKEQTKESDIKPLQPVTLEELEQTFKYNGSQVEFVDRDLTSVSKLNLAGKIVITGPMKSGKTREAVHLIREMIANGEIRPEDVYQINPTFPISLEEELLPYQLGIVPHRPVLILIDDFPRKFQDKKLEWLLKILFLAQEVCTREVKIIATARLDQLSEEYFDWFKINGFKNIELQKFNNDQFIELVKRTTQLFNIKVEESHLGVFLNSHERSPEHIIMCMKRLNAKGQSILTKEEAIRLSSQTLKEMWEEYRREIERIYPISKYILDSLACFYLINFSHVEEYFILHMAKYLWKKDSGITGFCKCHIKKVKNTIAVLNRSEMFHFDVYYFVADYMIEDRVSQQYAEQMIQLFLIRHKKVVRTRLLNIFYQFHKMHFNLMATLGNHHYYREENVKSREILKYAVRIDSDSKTYSNLGLLLEELGKLKKAKKMYEKAIKCNPRDFVAHYNLGNIFVKQKKKQQAKKMYKKAFEIEPTYAPAYFNLGVIAHGDGQIEEAKEMYRKAIDFDKGYVLPYRNLALIEKEDGKLEDAKGILREALKELYKEIDKLRKLSYFLGVNGRRAESMEVLNHIMTKKEYPNLVIYDLCCLYSLQHLPEEAFEFLKTAIELGLDRVWAWQDEDLAWLRENHRKRFIEIVGLLLEEEK